MLMAHRFGWTGGKIAQKEMIDILYDDSTGCKKALIMINVS